MKVRLTLNTAVTTNHGPKTCGALICKCKTYMEHNNDMRTAQLLAAGKTAVKV